MKKNFKLMISLVVAIFTLSMFGNTAFADASHDNIADGEYEIGIEALEKGKDKTSIADDFLHDATLTIEDGNPSLTIGVGAGGGDFGDFDFTIEWVTVEGNEPVNASEQGDLTYYTFELDNLDTVVPAGMKYVVPGFPGLEDGHEVDFDIKISGLDDLPEKDEEKEDPEEDPNGDDEAEDPEGDEGNGTTNGEEEDGEENANGAVEDNGDNDDGAATTDEEEAVNPQTGDSSNILLYSLMMIGALVPLTIIAKKRLTNK